MDAGKGSTAVREEGGKTGGKVLRPKPGVKPKGGRLTIADLDRGNLTEAWQFFMDDTVEEGMGLAIARIMGAVAPVPRLPGKGVRAKEFGDELHEQAMVSIFQVANTKAPSSFGAADPVPGNKTL